MRESVRVKERKCMNKKIKKKIRGGSKLQLPINMYLDKREKMWL